MKLILTTLSLLAAPAFAADPNILTPADLPKEALQIFSASGRGKIPNFPEGYGIEIALKENFAHQICMAPVGRQLSDWVTTRETGFYWNYDISAKFECLAPTVSVSQNGDAAKNLYASLKGVSEISNGYTTSKAADVLCFERLEEVCENGRLMGYDDRETCELTDRNQNNALITLDDLEHDNQMIRQEGANALNRILPVWRDGRRDDTPRGNCEGHLYNSLKGISRKSAGVTCSKSRTGSVECEVTGIIND